MTGRVREQLRSLGVTPSKERGQNFLINPAAIDQIVQFGRPGDADTIVEIGPGLGALTTELAGFPRVYVIEIEPAFCKNLEQQFPNVHVICSDVRQVNFEQLGSKLLVFGNLPYSFSTDILFHLISQGHAIHRAVLMLQKEFVARIIASPGSKAYGVLSIMCQLQSDPIGGDIIPGTSFFPTAQVESQLLQLRFLSAPRFPVNDLESFRRFLAAAFFRRRKKLLNSFKASGWVAMEVLETVVDKVGIDASRRPETLSVEEYALLYSAYNEVHDGLVTD